MLYTRIGDDGTTKIINSEKRIAKSSDVAEALGSLDEINSFLGLCKVKSKEYGYLVGDKSFAEIIHDIQQNLFIIQAEIAGAEMFIDEEKIKDCEFFVDTIEKILPPIKTFFISGGTELASIFDVARTLSRKAERRVVKISEENKNSVGSNTLAYLNRLSSLLYALARLSSHLSGINEEAPNYK